jgi:hypothetical protein
LVVPVTTAAGVDPGASSALAVVELGAGISARLLALHAVFGVRWHARMVAALDLGGPLYCERPSPVIRRGAPMRNHNAAFGLGRSVGRWEAVAAARSVPFHLLTTAEWWALLPTRLTGKRGDGRHRIAEAQGMIEGVAALIDTIPPAHQVDAAEAALIAYAGALLQRREVPRVR